jgi:hypothetical protein
VDAGGDADRGFEAPISPDLKLKVIQHDLATNSLAIEQLLINAGVIAGDRPPGGEFAI